MKTFDVWLYAVTVEAEDETKAIGIVNDMFDAAGLGDKLQVDYAEEII